jgi:glycosyltransferase involved in cell wall biosynthesis
MVKPSLGGADGELRKLLQSGSSASIVRVLGLVDRFAVIDPSIRDELLDVGLREDRLVVMKNGVDLTRFSPPGLGEREAERTRLGLPSGPIALFVGQLVERKGVAPLVEAWRGLRRSHPNATLVFAGQGELASLVEEEASRPESGIVLLGVRRDIVSLLRAANVLVLPSRNESFGNVILEAIACGIPVVVGRTGVAATLDLGQSAGRFVDPERPETIAAALAEIFDSPDTGAALGARGRDLASDFDFRSVAMDYLGVYETMMCERGRHVERVPA